MSSKPKVRELQRFRSRDYPDRDDPRIQRSCLEKKRYPIKTVARDAASKAAKTYQVPTDYYFCLHCRQFHLTTIKVAPAIIEVEHPSVPEPLIQNLAGAIVRQMVKRVSDSPSVEE